ncbi:MAG: S8 family serine peptidase [Terrimicrobiaceae bacterium]|jgi:subtilisin
MSHHSEFPSHREAEEALEKGRGRGIRLAVIDSGIELSHPALRGLRLVDDVALGTGPRGSSTRVSGRGVDLHGHGTAVAALIRRAAPEAQLGSFRVFDHKLASHFALIKDAAMLAIEQGYNILNCSFGARARMESMGHFKSWVDLAYQHGVHIVCPCNNLFFREAEWPGSFPSVLSVNMAATRDEDLFFRNDTAGGSARSHLVEFAARGVEIEVPWKGGTTQVHTGSSFAAAHVSGLLARFLSLHPRVKPLVAKSLLQEIATPWNPALEAPNC